MNIAEKRKYLETEFVSEKFGPIIGLKKLDRHWRKIQSHVAIANVAEINFIGDKSGFATSGLSLDSEDKAVVAAIMEGLERYSATVIPEKELLRLKETDSKNTGNFLEKFGKSEIDPKDISYTEFYDLDDTKILLPAQYAYFQVSRLGEESIIHNTTNGLAAHSSKEKAKEGAIMELVEREAILRTWINKIAPPQIKLRDTKYEKISQKLAKEGYNLTVFRINFINGIEIAFAVLLDEKPRKSFISVGAGSGFDLSKSVGSAIEECLQTRIWEENYYDKQPTKPNEIKNTFDRSQYWASEKNMEKIEFLYQNKTKIGLQNQEKNVSLGNLDLPEIYLKDVSTEELARREVHVLRAFCPDFNPFYLDEEWGSSTPYLCYGKSIDGGISTGDKPNKIPHPML